jgi:large subunit ribosomal protein L21
MYAVIATGGKQYKVEAGQQLDVERLGVDDGEVELRPVLLVDGDTVLATPGQLGGATVKAKVVGEA